MNLTVEPHQIHCLLGENGAGKSTLMNVLYGLYELTSGSVEIDGEPCEVQLRRRHGGGDRHGAPALQAVPASRWPRTWRWAREHPWACPWTWRPRGQDPADSRRYGFDVDPDAVVEDLPVGVQQRVRSSRRSCATRGC
ncbi:ATP-binding cassette domain-containing protein [Kocuria rhizophila]|nr:ATP-binding cassette domain-containing protein [Kocuria rhizophila]